MSCKINTQGIPGWNPADVPDFLKTQPRAGNPLEPDESTLQEAHRLTHGNRQADYGHPLDDYNRTAAIATALLSHKLKDGESISAAEMALLMVGVKLSRQVHRPKRDNMVDAAGYTWVAQECLDELARRQSEQFSTTETK